MPDAGMNKVVRAKLRAALEENVGKRSAVALSLTWYAGLRQVEFRELRWEQVDFDARVLRLTDREVPVDEALERCLRQWKSLNAEAEYVLADSETGLPPTKDALQSMIAALIRRAGITDLGAGDLRRDYAQRMEEQLGPDKAAAIIGRPPRRARRDTGRRQKVDYMPRGEAVADQRRPKRLEPDAAARLANRLESEPCSTASIVLQLAWYAGLRRDELRELLWEQVDFNARVLCLYDREVPINEALERSLRQWHALYAEYGPYVIISEKLHTRPTPQHITHLARTVLDELELHSVRLLDLSQDYFLRQLDETGWQDALRSAGVSLSTYRRADYYREVRRESEKKERISSPTLQSSEEVVERLRWILAQNDSGAQGLALRLYCQAGLLYDEIIALTWEQVDLEDGTIRLADRELPIDRKLADALRRYRMIEYIDDPHVLLTPISHQPMDSHLLTTLLRSLLVQGGIDETPKEVRTLYQAEQQKARILAYIDKQGSISAEDCAALLGISRGAARTSLRVLVLAGKLQYDRGRYLRFEAISVTAQREKAAREYLAAHGATAGKTLRAALRAELGVSDPTVVRLLGSMVTRGVLIRSGNGIYSLPEKDAEEC